MRKIKIFITVFVSYEFVMLTILQVPDYCTSIFNYNFCAANNFKYFLICVMLPVSFGLLVWWGPEISRLFCPHKCDVNPTPDAPMKNIFNEIISKKDIERLITAAVIVGVQKFVANHPKAKETFDNILDVLTTANSKKKK